MLDPELAAQLRLSKSQHDELLKDEFEHRSAQMVEVAINGARRRRSSLPDQRERYAEKMAKEQQAEFEATEWPIWNVLTPTQTKMLVRILGEGKKLPAPPIAKTKKQNRPS